MLGLVNFVEYDDIVKLYIRKASQRRLHSFRRQLKKGYILFLISYPNINCIFVLK